MVPLNQSWVTATFRGVGQGHVQGATEPELGQERGEQQQDAEGAGRGMLGAAGCSVPGAFPSPPPWDPRALGASEPGRSAARAKRADAVSIPDPKSLDAQRVPWIFPRHTRLPESRGSHPGACWRRDNPAITQEPRNAPVPRPHPARCRVGPPAPAGRSREHVGSVRLCRDAGGKGHGGDGSAEAQGLSWGQIPKANTPPPETPPGPIPAKSFPAGTDDRRK